MAEIILGIGSSHTPQLSTSAAWWSEHRARDEANPALLGPDGRFHSYSALLETADPDLARSCTIEVFEEKFARAQQDLSRLADALLAARPQAVVIVGDDQHELFGDELVPSLALFLGDTLWDLPPSPDQLARVPADIQAASWAAHAGTEDPYPVHQGLSGHLASSLTASGFELTVLRRQPEGRGLGHAFTFVRRRLGLDAGVPIVPVLLNTYFPPNVATPSRCVQLGKALAKAIESFEGLERVALLASGGLSHFVVLETLDRSVLDALLRADEEALSAVPTSLMASGTSETLNWIVAGGACSDLSFELVDYLPAYRSEAGTGVGMAFGLWHPRDGGANGQGANGQGAKETNEQGASQ